MRQPRDTPSAVSADDAQASTGRVRVLVLEDNTESRLLLSHLLRKEFDATLAGGVDETLEAAAANTFDVALLDINLGESRTGIDVLEAIRAMPQHRTLPALACTAYALPGDREDFLDAGFEGYVSKPFVRDDLFDALRSVASLRA
ncbi:MAG: response regulator [Bacteroidota bacterium]